MGRPKKTCAATKSSGSARTFARWLSVTRDRSNRPPDALGRFGRAGRSRRDLICLDLRPCPLLGTGPRLLSRPRLSRLLADKIEAGRDIDLQPLSISQRESNGQ